MCRIGCMLIETLALREPETAVPNALQIPSAKRKVRPTVTSKDQISQQTLWMIAVRDNRDKAAFAALFDHFAPRLKGFIMRTGTGSGQAEEIVQEVMLTVWHKASLFDPERAQVSSWIYQIARNRQIDKIRKENRRCRKSCKSKKTQNLTQGRFWGCNRKPRN